MMKIYKEISVLLIFLLNVKAEDDYEEPILYYYGLVSERGLPACGGRRACSALLQRYWRAPALLRLCRCARGQRCDTRAPDDRLVELNNRAHLQFCQPLTNWPECSTTDTPLTVEMKNDFVDPDELEDMHHQNVHLTPPNITLNCRCRNPHYWKLKSEIGHGILSYECTSLPLCKSGDFCGNVNNNLLSLYQSCLCPKNHICVHNGGLAHIQISELLYRGKGWRAYCQPISGDYSYEDY